MVDPVAPTRDNKTPKSLKVIASNKDNPKKHT